MAVGRNFSYRFRKVGSVLEGREPERLTPLVQLEPLTELFDNRRLAGGYGEGKTRARRSNRVLVAARARIRRGQRVDRRHVALTGDRGRALREANRLVSISKRGIPGGGANPRQAR